MDISENSIPEYDSIQFGVDGNYMSLRNTNTEATITELQIKKSQ